MSVFDKDSEEYKNLPKEFKNMVGFLSKSKSAIDKLLSEAGKDPAELIKQLAVNKEIIGRQFALIEKFVELPRDVAIVSGIEEKDGKKFVWILQNGKHRKVNHPDGKNLLSGTLVEISSQTAQIISETKIPAFGAVAKVAKLSDENTCEVNFNGGMKVVLRGIFGPKSANCFVKPGDRVVLDSSASIILANLGEEENKFRFKQELKTTWDDVVGLDEAKEKLKEIIELPYTHPDLFKHHNKKQIHGALLHGPHGNGKSMLLEASALASAKIHGPEALASGFIYIKCAELLEGIVGDGEKAIKRFFEQGEDHFEKHKYPALIAIEEPDAVFIKRGTGKSSDVERSMVDAMLAEMNHTRSIILMATNRMDILDPAFIRAKRIDEKIYVGRPNREAAAKIIEINLKGAPLEGSAKELAEYAAGEFFSTEKALFEIKRKSTGETIQLLLGHIIYGAMAANVAEKATSISFRRDVKNNTKSLTGKKELSEAIDATFEENMHLDHMDEIRDFVRDFKEDIADIKPLRQLKK